MATDAELADELVGAIRTWVDREVVPHAPDLEHADEFPEAMFAQMCEFGLFGATIPEAYGGLGLDATTYARIIEELSRGWMSLAGILNTHKIAATMIARYGTDEQRDRFLPRMCDGSVRSAFSLSEPDAGSDTRSIRCRAVPDGERVGDQRHQDVGDQRNAGPDGDAVGPNPRRPHHLLHRGKRARTVVPTA